jgi:phosphoribosylanthranilate isomerase
MPKVKICGLMRPQDVKAINEYMPDYAGFIFAPSRRRLSIQQAQALISQLSGDIKRVGIFVNEQPDVINLTKRQCGLDVVQIYQDSYYIDSAIEGEVWLGIRVKDESSLEALAKTTAYGGTGEKFNWDIAYKASRQSKIVLAGGLDSSNVAKAIKTADPYAVDVSSGVETSGVKDADKIRKFIEIVRGVR